MRHWIVAVLIWLAVPASAAIFTNEVGTFSALTSVTSHADSVVCDGAQTLDFSIAETGTTTIYIENSIDNGTTWASIAFIDKLSLTVDVDMTDPASAVGRIEQPSGRYRPAVTACTGCSMTMKWRCTSQK